MYQVKDVTSGTHRALMQLRLRNPIGAMLHTTDGVNSLDWLQRGSQAAGKPASADYHIERDGEINKLIPDGYHAYHAGVCRWQGAIDRVSLVSRRLVGIEIENADSGGQEPTLAQHHACAGLMLALADKYSWSPLLVYGHYGLAFPMGRRSDPHRWDWGYMFWVMAHAPERAKLTGAAI
jgi:N-acetyl-anhydromuramyl-L-alanine amidase AmpD